MASFSVAGDAVDLSAPDDLWALFKELLAEGWRGQVSGVPDGVGGAVLSLEVHIDDPDALNGTRTIKGAIGDKRVVIGDVISVMTTDAFTATYGGV